MAPMQRRHLFGAFFFGILALTAAFPAIAQGTAKPQPMDPQPAALQAGVVPVYYRNVTFNSIEEVLRYAKTHQGEAGKPIPEIDAITNGTMWDAGMKETYAIRLDGAVKLPAGSTYFAVNSNDGVQVILGGAKILEDGDVHGDRMTDPVEVKAPAAGWYPLRIWYFQKKNTATLQLLWQPPGATEFKPVPPEALGHP